MSNNSDYKSSRILVSPDSRSSNSNTSDVAEMRWNVKRRRRRSFRRIWTFDNATIGVLTVFAIFSVQFLADAQTIANLQGEPGFRMVSLKWKYPPVGPNQRSPISFQIKFCELHSWGLNRCRYQIVDEVSARNARQTDKDANTPGLYLSDVGGLRMATNYTFQVIPLDPGMTSSKSSRIALQTKGFSAKATNCLADSSEVIVETGPYFGGRISVEDSTVPGCYLKGNSQSPQTKYTLQIKHGDCGSQVNGSKVTSVILVQENVPILTHSTRRFVVVCSFSPDSFVVKAGVNLPRETNIAKSLDFSGLVRIPPRKTNLLNSAADRDRDQDHDTSSTNSQPEFISANNLEDDLQPQQSLRPISQFHSLTQAKPLSNTVAESRAFNDSLYQGTWETFLVFGMISVAIIASMCSVIWFVKSYRGSEFPGETQRIRRGHRGDIESLGGSSSGYSFSDSYSSSASNSNSNSLDTRSDFEVELDFEFSEDVNRPQEVVEAARASTSAAMHNPKPTNKYHSFA